MASERERTCQIFPTSTTFDLVTLLNQIINAVTDLIGSDVIRAGLSHKVRIAADGKVL